MNKIIPTIAAAAALALPAVASANVNSQCTSADTVQVNAVGFKNGNPYLATYKVAGVNATVSGTINFVGPSYTFAVNGVVGPGTVTLSSYGYTYTSTFANCTPPPPAVPPSSPPNTPPPPAVPTVTKKITCADLKRNKAGKKWLDEYGCKVATVKCLPGSRKVKGKDGKIRCSIIGTPPKRQPSVTG